MDRTDPNPAIDPANIVSDLKPFPLDCLDQVKILAAVNLAQHDVPFRQLPIPNRFDRHQLTRFNLPFH